MAQREGQREEGRAGVLGRPRHLDHHPWLKEHYGGAEVVGVLRRRRPGRRLRGACAEGPRPAPRKCIVKDLRDEFVRDYCYKALSAGAVYEDRYLLGTALARPLLAYHQVQVAIKEEPTPWPTARPARATTRSASRSTYGAFAPHLKVIAPWREWTIRSREDALDYARKHGVPVDQTKKDLFSRDGNLWHLSHEGGNLEDVWDAAGEGHVQLTGTRSTRRRSRGSSRSASSAACRSTSTVSGSSR